MKAADYIEKYRTFRTRGVPRQRKGETIYKWRHQPYSKGMKTRLRRFEKDLGELSYGHPIFHIGDWKFSIGLQNRAATKASEIPQSIRPNQGWLYFTINPDTKKDHSGELADILDPNAPFSMGDFKKALGLHTKGWNQLKIMRTRSGPYRFKIPIQYSIILANQLEKKYPEVAMALRKVYFDPGSGTSSCSDSIRIASIAGQKKLSKKADIQLIKKSVGPLATYKTKKSGFKFRPYQLIGIAFWASTGGRAMIADQMGIGKTAQAIGCIRLAMLSKKMKAFPALVVCPKGVIGQWGEALAEWLPEANPHVVIGKSKGSFPSNNPVIITTYASMVANKALLQRCKFSFIVFDESHLLKHMRTARSQTALALGEKAKYIVELTGTPMEKSTAELWPQFRILAPKKFPTEMSFITALEPYDIKERPSYVTVTTDIQSERALTQRYKINDVDELLVKVQSGPTVFANVLNCYMIRRLKGQVLNLPKKTRVIRRWPLSPAASKLYDTYEKETARWIKRSRIEKWTDAVVRIVKAELRQGSNRKDAIAKAKKVNEELLEAASGRIGLNGMLIFSELKRKLGLLKTVAATEFVKGFVRDNPKEPLLIFADQHSVIDTLVDNFKKIKKNNGKPLRVATYTGRIASHIQRDKIKKEFQDGKIDILILNQAGKLGIELPRASYILFAERWWNPGDEEQAEDRAHRSGKKEPVTVYYLLATRKGKPTVDERTQALIDTKRALQERVVGNQRYDLKSKRIKLQRNEIIKALQQDFNQKIGQVREPSNADLVKALKQAGVLT